MIWHLVHNVQAKKPAVCHVHLDFFRYSSFRIDAIKETGKEELDQNHRVNGGATVIAAVRVLYFAIYKRKINDIIYFPKQMAQHF